ncbi:hypothetical protein FHW75_004657 [Pseudomonas sp. OG7]|uniref:helix-turn-helix domain-containing protein n=1 Tax=Pseudomonas sp. OG7 TaxID=2587037 RepID=UPI00180468B2|nr:helix-turn-helix domain-containing protein [Pseudomonas sp. OG7]MBB3273446.1 hypothetical protein [Pseudomonas sp. OG7]
MTDLSDALDVLEPMFDGEPIFEDRTHSINVDDLPEQFAQPGSAVWSGAMQMRAIKIAQDAFPSMNGNVPTATLKSAQAHFEKHGTLDGWSPKRHAVGSDLARIDREAAAKRKAVFQAAGFKPRYATVPEVRHVMKTAHDACMLDGTRPSAAAMLRDAGVPAREATRLASKSNRNIAPEWRAQEQHPARAAMREQGVLTRRKENAATGGTLAGTVAALYSLADHTKDRQRLSAVEDEVAKLKAQVAALETRQTVTETGEHWHDIALRMSADGDGPTAIANATGQKLNTVKQFIKRSR